MKFDLTDPCNQLIDIIPAYAIGAADDDEIAFVDAHLADCPEAQRELAAYNDLSDSLLYSVPQQTPPPVVLDRIMRATAPLDAPVRVYQKPFWRQISGIAAGVLLVLLIASNAFWVANQSRPVTNEQHLILNYAGTGQTRQISLNGDPVTPAATLTWGVGSAQDTWVGLFSVERLPALERETYQVWLFLNESDVISAGTFDSAADGTGYLIFETGVPISQFYAIGVTVEPVGGSPAPTTNPVLAGNI